MNAIKVPEEGQVICFQPSRLDEAVGEVAVIIIRKSDYSRMVKQKQAMKEALQALTDPEEHIWHGNSKECTGECQDVRKALDDSYWK